MQNNYHAQVVEPEVMPVTRLQPLRFDLRHTVQSPFFWFVLGAGSAALGIWLIHRNSRRN